ncbi:hypothetical protein BS47DRAFT_1490346 [Hydnum rufescens UP504]|uniref:Uncharacterized protein n=1 Tax=Hydnum rufescens UP504 TaxID=1448309 RepID=A0A9P6AD92_9AGAM|nr:hypothetical protein BS47DRAFT_1490346 [Hydnum rufescens UP504]
MSPTPTPTPGFFFDFHGLPSNPKCIFRTGDPWPVEREIIRDKESVYSKLWLEPPGTVRDYLVCGKQGIILAIGLGYDIPLHEPPMLKSSSESSFNPRRRLWLQYPGSLLGSRRAFIEYAGQHLTFRLRLNNVIVAVDIVSFYAKEIVVFGLTERCLWWRIIV